jgi:RNA polymerase sigma-70 factor, ECF subfamily
MKSTAQLLACMAEGDTLNDPLVGSIYVQLRALAGRFLRAERANFPLSASAFVHETCRRLAGMEQISWEDRAQFFALARRTMRLVLVDEARRPYLPKPLPAAVVSEPQPGDLLKIQEALSRLAERDPRLARVAESRLAGFSEEEIAGALGVSVRSVKRDWSQGKAWLFTDMQVDRQ